MIINFEEGIIQWDSVKVPMKDYDEVLSLLECEINTLCTESKHVDEMNKRTMQESYFRCQLRKSSRRRLRKGI